MSNNNTYLANKANADKGAEAWHSFQQETKNPMELTTALLMKLHNIAESLEGMKKGERNVLTAYSYNHFNETSGTVGVPKVIPMTVVTKIWPHFCYLSGVGGDGFETYDRVIKKHFTGAV